MRIASLQWLKLAKHWYYAEYRISCCKYIFKSGICMTVIDQYNYMEHHNKGQQIGLCSEVTPQLEWSD